MFWGQHLANVGEPMDNTRAKTCEVDELCVCDPIFRKCLAAKKHEVSACIFLRISSWLGCRRSS
jgi:hypothetical protein